MSKSSITVLVGIVLVCIALALILPILSEITRIALGVIALVAGIVVWIIGARQPYVKKVVKKVKALQGQLEGPEEEMIVDSNNTHEDFTPAEFRCPICGSETVIRTSKSGPNVGSQFHVCTRYPACKGKIVIE